jgi:hypothetical protein
MDVAAFEGAPARFCRHALKVGWIGKTSIAIRLTPKSEHQSTARLHAGLSFCSRYRDIDQLFCAASTRYRWTRHIAPSVEKWSRQATPRYAAFPILAVHQLSAIARRRSALPSSGQRANPLPQEQAARPLGRNHEDSNGVVD